LNGLTQYIFKSNYQIINKKIKIMAFPPMTLMNFQDSNAIATRKDFFKTELNWIFSKINPDPTEALFIPYAYNGPDYPAFFRECSDVFGQAGVGIKLTDINSGNPATMIASAKMMVIPGGDIKTFIKLMNQLITATFNPWSAIKIMLLNGIPLVAWNEGAALISPKPFSLPSVDLTTTIGASPYQLVNNYTPSDPNRALIKTFLQNNPGVTEVTCETARPKEDKATVRLEETGGGILRTTIPSYPIVINYKLVGGALTES
jgi:hypothetical protein